MAISIYGPGMLLPDLVSAVGGAKRPCAPLCWKAVSQPGCAWLESESAVRGLESSWLGQGTRRSEIGDKLEVGNHKSDARKSRHTVQRRVELNLNSFLFQSGWLIGLM